MAKSKYITFECSYCHRVTKMEVIGSAAEPAEGQEPKSWFRCTRCKHSSLISTVAIEKKKKAATSAIDREHCTPYSREKAFSVGEEIFHAEWDDVGRVIRKDKTSGGVQTIVVSFEKLGERKLIENVNLEETEEDTVPQA